MQADEGDEALLKGHVPQPDDWLRVFSLVQDPVSFFKSAKQCQLDAYISIRRASVTRFAMKKLISVLAEIVRRKKRAWILQASHICVAMDDKAPYRLMRFRASVRSNGVRAASNADEGDKSPVRDGLLALLNHGHQCPSKMDVRHLDEDYSARMAESVSIWL